MTPKCGKGEGRYLNLCLHYLEHSVIDYSLNSLDGIPCFSVLFVLTMAIQLTPLKEKPDSSQE